MINAGKYNHRIQIFSVEIVTDSQGFQTETRTLVLQPYAEVKTTRGMTLITNNSDFERAYTRFVIRKPEVTEINRDMQVVFNGKTYTIEYLNNVDELGMELELQCKEVEH